MTDWELLRQYRENHSNEAFRKLADRHMKLVYSTCRRDLEDASAAEDATQLVFLLLARKAGAIKKSVSVSSWLFGAARFVCKDMIKSEMRRRRREKAAFEMDQAKKGDAVWDEIEPELNDALTSLSHSDRESVLMRYYDGMSLSEIASEIGTTEDTARKRVSRAVDKLHAYFQRRHAAAHLLSLDSLLVSYAAYSVPAHTHSAVMSTLQNLGAATMAAAGLNSQAGVLLKKGALVLMDATMKKVLIGLAIIAVVGVGIGVPVTIARIQSAKLSAEDTATLIDAAPATQMPADPSQAADRAQIVGLLRKGIDDFRRRDLIHWGDNAAPGLVTNFPGGGSMTFGQVTQQEQQTLQTMGPFKLAETINSLKVNGDRADLIATIHFEGTTVKYNQTPAGLHITSNQTQTSTWRKENGKWLTTAVDISSLRSEVNGKPVYMKLPPSQAASR